MKSLREILTEGKPDELKIGDKVHVGLAVKGGAGFEGVIQKLDGNWVTIKNDEGKIYKGLIKNAKKLV